MKQTASGVIARGDGRQRESFGDPWRRDASWLTLFSADITPTGRMSAGVMELEPGEIGLRLHSDEPPEIHHAIAGTGVLTINDVEVTVGPGSTAFIPGDAEHSLHNSGSDVLHVFYVSPTDRFADVVYRFQGRAT